MCFGFSPLFRCFYGIMSNISFSDKEKIRIMKINGCWRLGKDNNSVIPENEQIENQSKQTGRRKSNWNIAK